MSQASPSNLPANTPAEVIDISPESLEIANCYLQDQDIQKVASDLGITAHLVTKTLAKREVKAYIDNVFMNVGYNNQFKMRAVMDAVISKKLQDLHEADVGSGKDILEILALSHKMSMEHLDKQIEMEKAKQGNLKSQTNIQINDTIGGGSKYGALLQQIMTLDTVDAE